MGTGLCAKYAGSQRICDHSEWMRSEQCEEYVPDTERMASIDNADKWTITIIVDAETEDEAVYSKGIPKEFRCYVVLPSSYEQTLYFDAGYTRPLTGIGLFPGEDAAYYARSGSGAALMF